MKDFNVEMKIKSMLLFDTQFPCFLPPLHPAFYSPTPLFSPLTLSFHLSNVEAGSQLQYGRHARGHPCVRKLVAVQGCAGLYYSKQRYMVDTNTNRHTHKTPAWHYTHVVLFYSCRQNGQVIIKSINKCKGQTVSSKYITLQKAEYLVTEHKCSTHPLRPVVSCLG